MSKCEMLIDQIINHKHTEPEWMALQQEFDTFTSTASEEEIKKLEDSGAGEMLYMVCSGFKFDKANNG